MNIEMSVEDFYKSITGRNTTDNPKPEVMIFYTYKGIPVNEQFAYEYPEYYPSQEQIDEMCEGLKKDKDKGGVASFMVTEKGFEEIRPVVY